MQNNVISGPLRAGISNFVKSLAIEVAADGVTVNAVLPGWTGTARVKEIASAKMASVLEQIPISRLATPKEIGDVVAFLSSKPASYLTGQAIAVDGGFLRGV